MSKYFHSRTYNDGGVKKTVRGNQKTIPLSAEDKRVNAARKNVNGAAATGQTFSLKLDNWKVKNVVGSSGDTGNKIAYWEKNSGRAAKKCSILGCGGDAQVDMRKDKKYQQTRLHIPKTSTILKQKNLF